MRQAGTADPESWQGVTGPGAVPPPAAADVFGAALPLARRYAEMLAGDGIVRGLLGPHEADRLWERHLLNCAVVVGLVPRPCQLLDIGSGAGLPGVVLAMLLPDVQVTLLEPMARRVAFLDEVATALGLPNVALLRGRAEDVRGQISADVVTARAVAPLGRLASMAMPLVRPGGMILALKGERASAEAEAARPVLRRLGVSEVTVLQAGAGTIEPPATVIRLTAGGGRGQRGRGAAGGRRAGTGGAGGGGRPGREVGGQG